MSSIDPAFGNWLAGFIDGEGSFQIQTHRGSAGYVAYSPLLIVSVRDDDRAILDEIAERTGLGNVRQLRLYGCHAKGAKGQARWLVCRKDECLGLVGIFDAFPLRARKSRDYAVWREAVIAWQNVKRNGFRIPGDWSVLARCATEIKAVREYPSDACTATQPHLSSLLSKRQTGSSAPNPLKSSSSVT